MSGELLASGRDADVYALADGRVLRRYRDGTDAVDEGSIMEYVRAAGFPVPTVHHAAGPDLVLERLTGPTLLESLTAGTAAPVAAGELLADLHRQLHALPARWSTDPTARIIHLDLHPANVMLTEAGPMVIDWRTATEGRPDLDLAVTAVMIAQAAVGWHVPADLIPAAQIMLVAFLGRAGGNPVGSLGRARALRAVNENLRPEERVELDRAVQQVRQVAATANGG